MEETSVHHQRGLQRSDAGYAWALVGEKDDLAAGGEISHLECPVSLVLLTRRNHS